MTVSLLDAGYALIVAGAAWIFPPLALPVAGAFLLATWYVNDKRAVPAAREP